MKKVTILFLFVVAVLCAHAETIVLRTGARVKGTILMQNEQVVIIRDAEGARFQYPRGDVEEILADEVPVAEEQTGEAEETPQIKTAKKASILLELAGGAAIQPNEAVGGGASADLLVGSHHIGSRHLFIGAGFGYHGLFLGEDKYNFMPVQVALRIPFVETKHAPVFAASVGYGIALSKDYVGGIYAGIDFGYRYQLNPKTAISIVGFAQIQQAKINVAETIDDNTFVHQTGRTFFTPGVKMALYF